MPSECPSDLLERVAHRPWPLPDGPWIMTQSCHDMLFAHWPVSVLKSLAKIPAGLELDLFHGEAWLGIIPYRMSNVAPRGVPAIPSCRPSSI